MLNLFNNDETLSSREIKYWTESVIWNYINFVKLDDIELGYNIKA